MRHKQAIMPHTGFQQAPPPEAIQTEAQPRALPQVHGALRATDPKLQQRSRQLQRTLRLPTGRPLPKGFHRGDAPPMIGTTGPYPITTST